MYWQMKERNDRISERAGYESGLALPLVEDFYTVQGEGCNAGKAAYFIRLGGCDVGCRWCDSSSTWEAGLFPLVSVEAIAARALCSGARTAVVTGGEPLMHRLDLLTARLSENGLEVCLETSGTHRLSGRFDWICLSPKRQAPPLEEVCIAADELKVVVQEKGDLRWAEECARRVAGKCRLYLQPEWSAFDRVKNEIAEYVMSHPEWRISLQIHKFMNIP